MTWSQRIDPELAAAVELWSSMASDFGTMSFDDLPAMRQQRRELHFALAQPHPGVEISDRWVPGPAGAPDVRVRTYRPKGADGPLPGLYWVHGGGMIAGFPEADDEMLCGYAEDIGCVAVSVDYRLAPESPHPAPVEDCYAGLLWTVHSAAELGLDPERLAIGGGSAGAGIAAGTALMARDRGGPALVFQMLFYPMLDDRNTTPSAREFTDTPGWNRTANLFGWRALLGEAAGGDDVDHYAAPARAADLSGLPPAHIDVGELDPFRDECVEYALRLLRSGVPTALHVVPGVFHGAELMAPEAEVSRRMKEARFAALRRALTG
ncbi:MAG: alpha/beta hydrolase [Nocardiopsaceae bacterium]|nr:alpha/beta hydrolase [Nocardiopsaceae bacterium]